MCKNTAKIIERGGGYISMQNETIPIYFSDKELFFLHKYCVDLIQTMKEDGLSSISDENSTLLLKELQFLANKLIL